MKNSIYEYIFTKVAIINQKEGFLLGCMLGFCIPLTFIIYALFFVTPFAIFILIFLPLTSIVCGIMGIIAGFFNPYATKFIKNVRAGENKRKIIFSIFGICLVNIIFIILPLIVYIVWANTNPINF